MSVALRISICKNKYAILQQCYYRKSEDSTIPFLSIVNKNIKLITKTVTVMRHTPYAMRETFDGGVQKSRNRSLHFFFFFHSPCSCLTDCIE